jgi:mono/diheme cytochrome c family protein
MHKKLSTGTLHLATAVLAITALGCSSSQQPATTPPPPPTTPVALEPRDVRAEPVEAAAAEPAAAAITSTMDGVYTAEQSSRGEAAYRRACQSCHTPTLRGGVVIPALMGEDFMSKWSRMSVGDLFEKTRTTMPPSASRRLTHEEYADIVAFIFSKNDLPAGEQELSTEFADLKNIQIQPE